MLRIAVRRQVIAAYVALGSASKRTGLEFCSLVQGSDVANFTPCHTLRSRAGVALVRSRARTADH